MSEILDMRILQRLALNSFLVEYHSEFGGSMIYGERSRYAS